MTVEEYKEWKEFESKIKNEGRLQVINSIKYLFDNYKMIMERNNLRHIEEVGNFFITSLKTEYNLN